MATTLNRKDRESADQLLVRFNRASTRFVKSVRQSRYRADSVSPLKKKTAAVIRSKHRKANEKRKYYE